MSQRWMGTARGRRGWATALFAALAWSAACAACAAPEVDPVELELPGDEGVLVFEVSMAEVVEGANELELEVRVAETLEPVRGASIEIDAVHVEMGHGLDVDPTIEPTEAGGYLVRDLQLSMPGRWSIALSARGELHDTSRFDVVVR